MLHDQPNLPGLVDAEVWLEAFTKPKQRRRQERQTCLLPRLYTQESWGRRDKRGVAKPARTQAGVDILPWAIDQWISGQIQNIKTSDGRSAGSFETQSVHASFWRDLVQRWPQQAELDEAKAVVWSLKTDCWDGSGQGNHRARSQMFGLKSFDEKVSAELNLKKEMWRLDRSRRKTSSWFCRTAPTSMRSGTRCLQTKKKVCTFGSIGSSSNTNCTNT